MRALRRWFSSVGAQLVQQNQTNALSTQRQGGQCQWRRGGVSASTLRALTWLIAAHARLALLPSPMTHAGRTHDYHPSDSSAWLDQLPLSVVSDLQSLKQKYAETMQPLAQPVTFKVGSRWRLAQFESAAAGAEMRVE